MGKTPTNEVMNEENTSRRNLLKKAYKMPLLVSLGTMMVDPENLSAGISDGPPLPPGQSLSQDQSTFNPFPN